jgi:hypothetical protein
MNRRYAIVRRFRKYWVRIVLGLILLCAWILIVCLHMDIEYSVVYVLDKVD